jgi:hypothetical protein
MSTNRPKYYDTHTLYVTSGVAREEQLHRSLKTAIQNGEENLYNEDLTNFISNLPNVTIAASLPSSDDLAEKNKLWAETLKELGYMPPEKRELSSCKIRVNLIVNKNGDYYGFGYIHVSREDVYWMLLGKNSDGTDRTLEYLDPDWVAPIPKTKLTDEEEHERYSKMKWYEIAEEEDKYVHPTIRKVLSPLMPVPGYRYDDVQYRHHQEIAKKDGKDPTKVPKIGYFEFSRAYARDVETGKIPYVLCARQVPEWIPTVAFKQVFRDYATDSITKVRNKTKNCLDSFAEISNEETHVKDYEKELNDGEYKKEVGICETKEGNYDNYPFINLIDGKKDTGRIVFITFDDNTRDAIFALLMTRKVNISHPRNSDLKCTLIFDHAYEKGMSVRHDLGGGKINIKNNEKDRTRDKNFNKPKNNHKSDNYCKINSSSSGQKNTQNSQRDDIDIGKYNYAKK